jgi:hypothetical protein
MLPNCHVSQDLSQARTSPHTLTMCDSACQSGQGTFMLALGGRSATGTNMVCPFHRDSTGQGLCLLH